MQLLLYIWYIFIFLLYEVFILKLDYTLHVYTYFIWFKPNPSTIIYVTTEFPIYRDFHVVNCTYQLMNPGIFFWVYGNKKVIIYISLF